MADGWRILVTDNDQQRVFLAGIADLDAAKDWVLKAVPAATRVEVEPLAGEVLEANALLEGQIVEWVDDPPDGGLPCRGDPFLTHVIR